MELSFWLRRAIPGCILLTPLSLNQQGRSRVRACKHSFRPHLEPLERRELPTAGFLDQSFGTHGVVIGTPEMAIAASALQADDKIVVAGGVPLPATSTFAVGLQRFNSDGTVDTSFGNNGLVQSSFSKSDGANGVAIQPDGKIVTAGDSSTGFLVARYTSGGVLDPSFGNGAGYVMTDFHDIAGAAGRAGAEKLALQPDGKIVVAGSYTYSPSHSAFAVACYNPDGSLDSTFGGGPGEVLTEFPDGTSPGIAGISAVAIQPDGRIVAAGAANEPSPQQPGVSQPQFALARYYADGTLDPDFNGDGKVTTPSFGYNGSDEPRGLAIQPDGKLLVVGGDSATNAALLRRYNPDGSLEQQYGFAGPGGAGTCDASRVAVQADGSIIVAGLIHVGQEQDFLLARFTPDMRPDTSFSFDGLVETNFPQGPGDLTGLAIEADGKILAVGSCNFYQVALVRYNGDAGQFQFSAATYGAVQTDASVGLTVTRTDGSSGTVTVDYATSDGTATVANFVAGGVYGDYFYTKGTITFGDGETSKIISIKLHDDGGLEGGTETFQVTLSNPTGGAVLAAAPVPGVIATLDATTTATATAPPTTATVTIMNLKVVTLPVSGTEGAPLTGKLASFVPYDPTIPASDYAGLLTFPTDAFLSNFFFPVSITANAEGGFDVTVPPGLSFLPSPFEEGPLVFDVSISVGAVTAFASGTIQVADAPLTTHPVFLTVAGNKNFSGVVATFSDANPGAAANDYTATIKWDNGTTSPGAIGVSSSGFTVSGSHTFSAFQNFHVITVLITDHGALYTVHDAVKDPPAKGRTKAGHRHHAAASSHRDSSLAAAINGFVESDHTNPGHGDGLLSLAMVQQHSDGADDTRARSAGLSRWLGDPEYPAARAGIRTWHQLPEMKPIRRVTGPSV
jgi:uncharacterized delta-60 repeat protein